MVCGKCSRTSPGWPAADTPGDAHFVMNLFAKFARHCRTAKLFTPDDTILLAVSGGVDSVVMLDLFVELSQRQGQKLSVAHIDHQLRAESTADASFVQSLATAYGLPFFSEKISTREYAHEQKVSLEMAGRTLRYQALEHLRRAAGADFIATAHTRNDQAETVLYRLLRGSGLAGLAGIAEKRGNILRPLLGFARADILAYAQSRELKWREDVSNADRTFPRNRLRHEVIPLLAKNFNRDLVGTLARTAKIAREAHSYMKLNGEAALLNVVKEQTTERIVLDIQQISEYNQFIHAYILRQALDRIASATAPPSYREIERALKLIASARVGARLVLGSGCELLLDRDGLVVQKNKSSSFTGEVELSVPYRIPGTPWRLLVEAETWHADRSLTATTSHSQYVDAAMVTGRLRVRWPRRGDSFFPLGMKHPKKVYDFFADNRLPIRQRATTPLLECDNGIVWVCGFRIDDRFKVSATTERVLHLQLLKSS